jgi:hypothetical protein
VDKNPNTIIKCMPAAFPMAVTITNKLKTLFENRFIGSAEYISEFTCEFIEDAQGVCYFLKVQDYELESKSDYVKEW